MNEQIQQQLCAIEREYGVKIIAAIESGSRAWGFPSPDSDYDVRFIYAHPKDWYLQIYQQSDVIELAINAELDINGWDLKKALTLGAKGNAVLLEWLNSPVVYRQADDAVDILRQGVNAGFNAKAGFYHYYSQAKKFITDIAKPGEPIKLKRFFYCCRASLCALWIRRYQSAPPVAFDKLVAGTMADDTRLNSCLKQLIEQKSKLAESQMVVVDNALIEFVVETFQQLDTFDFAATLAAEKIVGEQWNQLFRDVIAAL